jgi:predicted nucleotidyltransferase
MQPTPYTHVNNVLNRLLSELQMVLKDKLVGIYLFGSLVAGDFDETISDIDLLVSITHELDQESFDALDKMYLRVTQQYPQWDNRIELAYVSEHALKTFRTESYKIGIVSPGEPFHIIDSSDGWLMNWYLARETGQTLFGQPKEEVISPITKEEYIQTVKTHTIAWREYLKGIDEKPGLSYAVLTLCRGFYTLIHQHPASKVKASTWVKTTYPQWETLIENALKWRHDTTVDDLTPEEIHPTVQEFMEFVIGKLP